MAILDKTIKVLELETKEIKASSKILYKLIDKCNSVGYSLLQHLTV